MGAVDNCFSCPDIAVIRNGHISGASAFSQDNIHVGANLADTVAKFRRSSSGMGAPRTAANLVAGYLRRELVGVGRYKPSDPTTKLGIAVVSAEHADGLTILGITHADNRYEARQGACNDISIIASSKGDGRELLDKVWRRAQTRPLELIASLHEQMGEGLPAELQIGAFAVYNYEEHQYDFVIEL